MVVDTAGQVMMGILQWVTNALNMLLTLFLDLFSGFSNRLSVPQLLVLIILITGAVWYDYHEVGFIKNMFEGEDKQATISEVGAWLNHDHNTIMQQTQIVKTQLDGSMLLGDKTFQTFSYAFNVILPDRPNGIVWTKLGRTAGLPEVGFWQGIEGWGTESFIGVLGVLGFEFPTHIKDNTHTDYAPVVAVIGLTSSTQEAKNTFKQLMITMANNGSICPDSQRLGPWAVRGSPSINYNITGDLNADCWVFRYHNSLERMTCETIGSIYGIPTACADVSLLARNESLEFVPIQETKMVYNTGGIMSIFQTVDYLFVYVISAADYGLEYIPGKPLLLMPIYILLRSSIISLFAILLSLLALSAMWGVYNQA